MGFYMKRLFKPLKEGTLHIRQLTNNELVPTSSGNPRYSDVGAVGAEFTELGESDEILESRQRGAGGQRGASPDSSPPPPAGWRGKPAIIRLPQARWGRPYPPLAFPFSHLRAGWRGRAHGRAGGGEEGGGRCVAAPRPTEQHTRHRICRCVMHEWGMLQV